MTATTQTVRDIALENPSSIRIFERLGIDYCCGGRIPLTEECAAKNLEVEDAITSLEEAAKCGHPELSDWTQKPLASLADHIVATHHCVPLSPHVHFRTCRGNSQWWARTNPTHGNTIPFEP